MMNRERRQQAAYDLVENGEVSLLHLWLLYWGEGGNAGEVELEAYIHGIPLLDGFEEEILGWALEPLLAG